MVGATALDCIDVPVIVSIPLEPAVLQAACQICCYNLLIIHNHRSDNMLFFKKRNTMTYCFVLIVNSNHWLARTPAVSKTRCRLKHLLQFFFFLWWHNCITMSAFKWDSLWLHGLKSNMQTTWLYDIHTEMFGLVDPGASRMWTLQNKLLSFERHCLVETCWLGINCTTAVYQQLMKTPIYSTAVATAPLLLIMITLLITFSTDIEPFHNNLTNRVFFPSSLPSLSHPLFHNNNCHAGQDS